MPRNAAKVLLLYGKGHTVSQLNWSPVEIWWHTERKWRGNWRMEWVASTLHTISEHCVSSITTADAHTSAASRQLNWRPRRFKWTRPFRRKTKTGFCACAYHISNAVYLAINKRGGVEAQLHASLTSAPDGGWWSPSRSDHFKLSIAIYKRRSCGPVKLDELFRRRAKSRRMGNTRLYSFKNLARDCISVM